MLLSDIKEYLKTQKQASIKDIAVRFDVSESALREMIAHWERKGKIAKIANAGCDNPCGQQCGGCPVQCHLIYQWNDASETTDDDHS